MDCSPQHRERENSWVPQELGTVKAGLAVLGTMKGAVTRVAHGSPNPGGQKSPALGSASTQCQALTPPLLSTQSWII